MKTIVFLLEKSTTGYGVSSPDVPGCFSYGDSIQEAVANMRAAIEAHIEVQKELGIKVKIDPNYKHKVEIQTSAFFSLFKELNATAIAKRAKMNPSLIRQYSTGKKHPSIEQIRKIEQGIKSLAKELEEISIV